MKKILFFIILVLGALLYSSEPEHDSPKINMLIFLTDNNENCNDLQLYILPELESKHHLEYTLYYDFEDSAKSLLSEIEQEFGKIDDFPIILMGNKLIEGDEIYSKLETTIDEYAGLGGCCVPLLFDFEEKQQSSDKFPVHIAYIYRKDSAEFERTLSNLEKLKQMYILLDFKKYNIDTENGKQVNDALCTFFNVVEKNYNKTPKMFIGDDTLIEDQVNYDAIKMLIKRYQENEDIAPWERISIVNKGEK